MNSFQKTVVTIAIIILILCLTFSAIGLHNKKKKTAFPPIQSTCPDYWTEESSEKCVPGANFPVHVLSDRCRETRPLIGKNKAAIRAAASWADGCGITWDGVTNRTFGK
tara:strand:+ start:2113 stop:2439 length:327 start_codon:yes stop_codon:yes gene_type:complete